MEQEHSDSRQPPRRKRTVADGIYAFAVTILIVGGVCVLGIIAFPFSRRTFGQSEEVQAVRDSSELAAAIASFFSDTQQYPVLPGEQKGDDVTKRTDAKLVAILAGENETLNGGGRPYYNGREGKGDRGGLVRGGEGWKFVDPWGEMYYIKMDTSRDSYIESPHEPRLRKYVPVLVWSSGPDGMSGTEDDVRSW